MTQSNLMMALAGPNLIVTLVPGGALGKALFSWTAQTSDSFWLCYSVACLAKSVMAMTVRGMYYNLALGYFRSLQRANLAQNLHL
jgi:hypothetical protein